MHSKISHSISEVRFKGEKEGKTYKIIVVSRNTKLGNFRITAED